MHYSTASESNKAEEEQRKWEAERERDAGIRGVMKEPM